jgi:hypothetical protein
MHVDSIAPGEIIQVWILSLHPELRQTRPPNQAGRSRIDCEIDSDPCRGSSMTEIRRFVSHAFFGSLRHLPTYDFFDIARRGTRYPSQQAR